MPHATKYNCKSVFVKNRCMITSRPFTWDSFNPRIVKERKNANRPKRMTTMACNHNGFIFIYDQSMTFSSLWFPPVYLKTANLSIINNIFRKGLLYRFLNNLTNFGIGRQMFLLILINVQ